MTQGWDDDDELEDGALHGFFSAVKNVRASHVLAAVVVRQTGSYAKAAKVCGTDRGGMMNKVKSLEEQLGVQLFERGGVAVTPCVDESAEEAWRILESAYEPIVNFWRLRMGPTDFGDAGGPAPFRIGCFPAHVARFVGASLTSWRDAGHEPRCVLRRPGEALRREFGNELKVSFDRQQVEMAILRAPAADYVPSRNEVPLFNWHLTVVAADGSEFDGDVVDAKALAKKRVIVSPAGHSTRRCYDDLTAELRRRSPEIVYEGSSYDVCRALCNSGFGLLITASDAIDEDMRSRSWPLVARGFGRGEGFMVAWQERLAYRYHGPDRNVHDALRAFASDLHTNAVGLRTGRSPAFAESNVFTPEQLAAPSPTA